SVDSTSRSNSNGASASQERPPALSEEEDEESRFRHAFEVKECLGSGAFGDVFRVKDKVMQKFYAVKIVHSKSNALREVEALSDLLHINIIRYFSSWEEETRYQDGSDSFSG
uniref:Protein kinase domain-containing protein n=1 Tax=Tetraodon nigroviridis TaxID=99883 RepID=H3C4N5_TETNG